jgi:type II secretory pathway predicted ATPase ExeA
MNPTISPTTTDAAGQLLAAAQFIETYRADLGLTKASLLRDYPELGSDKTYGKLVLGDASQLDVEKWLACYQHVWAQIQHDDQGADDGLIESLTAPVELCRSYLETRNERGNGRFILMLGESGVGKTSAVQVMKSKPYGGLIYDLEATDVWKDKSGRGTAVPLLQEIGERIGLKDLPASKSRLLKAVMQKLRERRICLVIEEVHHLCPQGVNTLKTLINLTPVIIIATGLPVLWDKLAGSRTAWAECKQLTGNRLAERIELKLTFADVASFITRRLGVDIATQEFLDKGASALGQEATSRGNMKFVAKVVQTFQRQVAKGEDATLETFKNAIAQEKKRR